MVLAWKPLPKYNTNPYIALHTASHLAIDKDKRVTAASGGAVCCVVSVGLLLFLN